MMKFNFKIQQYQTDAVNAVVEVFRGQPFASTVSYRRDLGTLPVTQQQLSLVGSADSPELLSTEDLENDAGFKNEELHLTDAQLLENIRAVQRGNGLQESASLAAAQGRLGLDIEMETGTGKTYVYIKTMFELNRLYGWSKFVVVVPSIAIREGVKKSFEITAEHFMECYGKKARFFVYNSSNLNQLDAFSSNAGLNVMIINTQAFAASLNEDKNVEGRKGDAAARIIFTARDSFGSRKPIDVIAANRPILILDEPQKMGNEKDSVTQKALRNFNPLFSLYYSATHKTNHNAVYALDALDAYNQRLVKKIEVKGFEVKNLPGTNQYLYLEDLVLSAKKPPCARIELEVRHKNGVKRELRLVEQGDNLYYISKEMEQYKGLVISEIDAFAGEVHFTNGLTLKKGNLVGDESKELPRLQIRETIISHLEKERQLFKLGIKTLSLFFIDEVAKYRQYDEAGNEILGEYGRIFEEEYRALLPQYRTDLDPAYTAYLDVADAVSVHRGYFSIDKKGHCVDSALKRGADVSDDISAYDLILKNKERLLSFEESTRFIFSHSALREGWDNPNVFQICTLKHSNNTTNKRQEVGRGLRLSVDRSGNRMDRSVLGENVQKINLLTVIASESYAGFVDDLQKKTAAELRERPKKATQEYFAGRTVQVDGKTTKLSETQARQIYNYLLRNDYIDDDANVTARYRETTEYAPVKEELKPFEAEIHRLVHAIYDPSQLASLYSDGNKTKINENPLNERFYKEEFQKLWTAINHKYAYTVDFQSEELIQKAIAHINSELYVSRLQYTVTAGSQAEQITADQVKEGSSFFAAKTRTETLRTAPQSTLRYDLIGTVAKGTVLTRRTVASILQGIDASRFALYRQNPEEFIAKVIRLINEQKATMIVEHIRYDTLEGSYDSDIFTAEAHKVPLDMAFKADKAIQDYVFTDGSAEKSVERRFAEKMDKAEEVKIYAKLPKGFQIPTPVGNYTPDWAIVFREGSVKHIYFIAETKGSMSSLDLRPIEKAKISCAKRLFEKLSNGSVHYDHVDSYEELQKMLSC